MDSARINDAAALLFAARRDRATLSDLPAALRPVDAREAYAMADAVAALVAAPVAGWKVGATTDRVLQMLNLAEPFAGRAFAPEIVPAPGRFAIGAFPATPLEAEYVVALGADLPPRDAPYTRAEVDAAVAAVHVGMELTMPHFTEPLTRPGLWVLADNGSNAGILVGPAIADWRNADLLGTPVRITVNGVEVTAGQGSNVMGHPLNAVTWLANHVLTRGTYLRAGDLISSGSCAGFAFVKPGDEVVAEFKGQGEARVSITAE